MIKEKEVKLNITENSSEILSLEIGMENSSEILNLVNGTEILPYYEKMRRQN